jgi:hypothetical protein
MIPDLSRHKQGTEKQLWLITYGASSESITHVMLNDCGLEVEECYTATWRESKYTLIRVHRDHRLRRTGMQKVMSQMVEKFRVIETEICGFDSVSTNSKEEQVSLEDHPGFKLMVQKANKDPVDMEWWIQKGVQVLAENRRGLLWRHIESTNARSMTYTQLITRVETWKPIVREVEELRTTNAMLMEHVRELEKTVRELEKTVRDERAFNDNMLIQFASGGRPSPNPPPSLQ